MRGEAATDGKRAAQPVRFGITFLPGPPGRFAEWCRAAEAAGFDLIGIADSQSLYREVYVSTTLCAVSTERVRFGPRVINPLTRHPAVAASAAATLEELAPGRTLLGIGTGFSAVYNVGLRAATLAQLEAYLRAVRGLLTEGTAEYDGRTLRQTWGQCRVPLYVAASGPRTLRLAGQVADGVVIYTGLLPEIIRDSIDRVRAGAVEAGRDPDAIDLWWFPVANLADDRRAAIDEIKMSLAPAGSHLARFGSEGKHVPPELLPRIEQLAARYRIDQHDQPASVNRDLLDELGLVEYLAERYAIVGTPTDCVRKIDQAAEAGARQFWISVHFDDKLRFIREWSELVMPAFR
jgi:5,10-methylenetetrahydromethanopterin reductase